MRPGPGLVVMVLAFLSGARRGGTTSIPTITNNSTNSSSRSSNNNNNITRNINTHNPTKGNDINNTTSTTDRNNNNNNVANQSTDTIHFGDDSSSPDWGFYADQHINPNVLSKVNPWLSACDLELPEIASDIKGKCVTDILPIHPVSDGPGPPSCPESCTVVSGAKNRDIHSDTMSQHTDQQQQKQQQRQRQRQPPHVQCLDYFGDSSADSTPQQLCLVAKKTDITARLRSLRLRHCCERNVLSAIRNEVLEKVLKGGTECEEHLKDLQDADELADRVTCELNRILVRYDCRQLYSIKHGCLDCKEAYRRWVCSTLIPYFAEPEDLNNTPKAGALQTSLSIVNDERQAAASPLIVALSHIHKRHIGVDKQLASIAGSRVKPTTDATTGESASSKQTHTFATPISTGLQLWSSATADGNRPAKRSHVHDHNNKDKESVVDVESTVRSSNSSTNRHNTKLPRQKQKPHSTDGICSSCDAAAVAATSPLRRSRRKSETLRRRIRPCLSVCQTVEENCPYMLPSDRAPAMPTQYAGEPTFLCSDPNIPETGDQLSKSNYGPEYCCYRYCSASVLDGLCTECNPPAATTPTLYVAQPHQQHHGSSNMHNGLAADDWYSDQCVHIPATAAPGPRCKTPFQVSVASSAARAVPYSQSGRRRMWPSTCGMTTAYAHVLLALVSLMCASQAGRVLQIVLHALCTKAAQPTNVVSFNRQHVITLAIGILCCTVAS